jgi:hypothetical protein
LPLAVHRPAVVKRQAIALIEGVGAKPRLLALRRGQVVVGAAGGQFASSPQTLEVTLKQLSVELNTHIIEFYPDAGAVTTLMFCGNIDRLGGDLTAGLHRRDPVVGTNSQGSTRR